jgi:hypothetical protein
MKTRTPLRFPLPVTAGTVKTRLSWCNQRNRAEWPEVDAVIVGQFAVCECTEHDKEHHAPWRVVHRGTGMAASWAMTEAQGIHAAREFMALPVVWKFRSPQTARAIREAHREEIAAIRARAVAPTWAELEGKA